MLAGNGLRVICRGQPSWGLGHVLADDGGATVTVFFLGGGKRVLDTTIVELDLMTGNAATNAILDVAACANWAKADRHLYVVELQPAIFDKERRFFEANRHWVRRKPCVHVGMTGLTPDERFKKHQRGEKDAWFVHRYGHRLLPDLYTHLNPMPYDLACLMEPELARQLRQHGYAVWQN